MLIDNKQKLDQIPSKPGVYLFKDKNDSVIYVGKSIDLRTRVQSYFQTGTHQLELKIAHLKQQIDSVSYFLTESDFAALILEANLIKRYQPRYNSRLKDDKRYLYIQIMQQEEFPRISTARKKDQSTDALYFGPYPSSTTVRDVLRLLRRIFPYCTQQSTARRACFYSHIRLCDPCPADIVKRQGQERNFLRKKYRQNIKNIISLLNGESTQVLRRLKRQMMLAARQLRFEEAAVKKKQYEQLEYIITHRQTSIDEYLEESAGETASLATDNLLQLLRPICNNLVELTRVEGYDISNTQGQYTTGAMVVFTEGEPAREAYRRFKMQSQAKPDDPQMVYELLTRRLKHKEWDYPDLILVDGGKSQVMAAKRALQEQHLVLPVIGLAKKEEVIIVKQEEYWHEMRLSNDSFALHLLQRVRDEAHRFANKYHKHLRVKNMYRRA